MTIGEELAIIGPLVLRLMAVIGGAVIEARKDLAALGLKGPVEPLSDQALIDEVHALDMVYAQIHVMTSAGESPSTALLRSALTKGRALVKKLSIIAVGGTLEDT